VVPTPDDENAFGDVASSSMLMHCRHQWQILHTQLLAMQLALCITLQGNEVSVEHVLWPHQVAVGAEDDLGVMCKLARGKVGACRQPPALARQVLNIVHLHDIKAACMHCRASAAIAAPSSACSLMPSVGSPATMWDPSQSVIVHDGEGSGIECCSSLP
jgi:hypothetical protein